jgi:hypothetical protein
VAGMTCTAPMMAAAAAAVVVVVVVIVMPVMTIDCDHDRMTMPTLL